jgi:hypothetical protein
MLPAHVQAARGSHEGEASRAREGVEVIQPIERNPGGKTHDMRRCVGCAGALPARKQSKAGRFCSARCYYKFRKDHNPARLKPCQVCGKPRGSAGLSMPSQKTCSAKCGYELRKRTLRPPRACNECGREYFPSGIIRLKFCSRACWRVAVNRRQSFVVATCQQCGGKFRRTQAALKRVKRTFCSHDCSFLFNRGENSSMFRGDKDPNRGGAWNRRAEAIRVRDGHSCRRCGRSQAENKQKLSVDHVRPWRSFTDKDEANHESNLISLCRRCHSYKTSRVERRLLAGDVLIWKQWIASLHLPSLVESLKSERLVDGGWEVEGLI